MGCMLRGHEKMLTIARSSMKLDSAGLQAERKDLAIEHGNKLVQSKEVDGLARPCFIVIGNWLLV